MNTIKHTLVLTIFMTACLIGLCPTSGIGQLCIPTATKIFEPNNAYMRLGNAGDIWQQTPNPSYYIPIVPNSLIKAPIIDEGFLWISGYDSGANLHTATPMSNINGGFYSPGPMYPTSQPLAPGFCTAFDQIFELTRTQVQDHINLSNLGLPIPIASIDPQILNWPARGNIHFTAHSITDDLAPFVDVNLNNIYDPENGDYPSIKGDRAFFYVLNDFGPISISPNGLDLRFEIHLMGYGFDDPSGITDLTTFYDVKIINKSLTSYNNLKVGLFTKYNLGDPSDDYIGCDTIRDAAFVYNANANDPIYGSNPPFVSTIFLNQRMSSFTYFNDVAAIDKGRPDVPAEYRNYMDGRWKDGSPFVASGDGYPTSSSVATEFAFLGNPATSTDWTEVSAATIPGQRLTVQSFGDQISIMPDESLFMCFAVTAYRPINYTGIPNMTTTLFPHIDNLTQLYTDSLQFENTYQNVINSVSQIEEEFVSVFPNPVYDEIVIDLSNISAQKIMITNMKGQILHTIESNFSQQEQVDMSAFPIGMYFIQVQTPNGLVSHKFIKQ